jgi:hypothetical protein
MGLVILVQSSLQFKARQFALLLSSDLSAKAAMATAEALAKLEVLTKADPSM